MKGAQLANFEAFSAAPMEDKTALRRQLYASKTIEELCSMLETLGKDFRGPKMSRELCDLVYMLKTQRLRHRKDAGSFSRAGGVSSLVRMLPVSEETRDRILLLSTIANVCWLDCSARSQVCNSFGVPGPSRAEPWCTSATPTSITLFIFYPLQVMNLGLEEIGMESIIIIFALLSKIAKSTL